MFVHPPRLPREFCASDAEFKEREEAYERSYNSVMNGLWISFWVLVASGIGSIVVFGWLIFS